MVEFGKVICKICNKKTNYIFSAKVLNKYYVKYYHCPFCGFIQTEEPFWLEEAYSEAITSSDTGILQRNLHLSKLTTILIFLFFDKNAKFLDYAGGYGVFVRLMRDIGFDFYWYDKYAKNLFARGFEYHAEMGGVELITCFEAFEHFVNPMEEIENMLKISKNILFTTELYGLKPPNPDEWWYYGLSHGQHISFYSINTLKFIADKYRLHLCTDGKRIHILTLKPLNRFLFNFVLKFLKIGVFFIVKKFLNSRTVKDYEMLILKNKL